jgi:translocator protein
MEWYRKCALAPWQPPDYVFGIVWPILYILYAFVSYLHWDNTDLRNTLILGILLNFAWVPLFTVNVKLAFILLTVMIVVALRTVYLLYVSDVQGRRKGFNKHALLFSPYLIWLCFAWTLNLFLVYHCK